MALGEVYWHATDSAAHATYLHHLRMYCRYTFEDVVDALGDLMVAGG